MAWAVPAMRRPVGSNRLAVRVRVASGMERGGYSLALLSEVGQMSRDYAIICHIWNRFRVFSVLIWAQELLGSHAVEVAHFLEGKLGHCHRRAGPCGQPSVISTPCALFVSLI